MTIPIDLTFTPSGYGDDPVEEIFSAIEDEAARATARRLLAEERLKELERLLKSQGILNQRGNFNHEDHAFSFDAERPEDLEGEETRVATLQLHMRNADYYSAVYVRRTGWQWKFQGSFDGLNPELGTSTTPLDLSDLIDLLDETGLVEHFREMSDESDDSIFWDSDLYPELGSYSEQENEEWQRERRRWEGDVVEVTLVSRYQENSVSPRAAFLYASGEGDGLITLWSAVAGPDGEEIRQSVDDVGTPEEFLAAVQLCGSAVELELSPGELSELTSDLGLIDELFAEDVAAFLSAQA